VLLGKASSNNSSLEDGPAAKKASSQP